MQSGPKSLDLPPPCMCILKAIKCWGVAKVEFTRLEGYCGEWDCMGTWATGMCTIHS